MDISRIVKEAFNFFSTQWYSIFMLTIPWFIVENSAFAWFSLQIEGIEPEKLKLSPMHFAALLGAIVILNYIYACVTLFMRERSEKEQVSLFEIWRQAWSYVPYLMMATVLSGTAILVMSIPAVLTGFLPLLAFSIWMAIRLAYINFFIVIEHATPAEAVRKSLYFSEGIFLNTSFAFSILFFISIISGIANEALQGQPSLLHIAIDSLFGFMTLFVTVLLYRIYMLKRANTQHTEQDHSEE